METKVKVEVEVEVTAAIPKFSEIKPILRDIQKYSVDDAFYSWGVTSIVKVLKVASDAYYNEGQGAGLTEAQLKVVRDVFTDATYDAYFDYLKENYPNNPYLKKVGAPVQKSASKEKLPAYLGSLNKVKPSNVDTWLEKNPGPWVVSDKLDGNSALLVVSPTSKKALYSRGDGLMGQNISHLVPHLKIPKKIPPAMVRGEAIMSESKFKKYEAEGAKNARNTLAGILNRKEVSKAVADTDFVAYEIVKPRMKPSEAFKQLKSWGLDVPFYKVYKTLDAVLLSDLLKERKKKSPYALDGLVITQDKSNPVNKSGNPVWSVAYKEDGVESAVRATVLEVSWAISKHGYLKPTILLEPVQVGGVTIKRTTGFNAKFIEDNGIGKGAIVLLHRAGEVIPHISKVIKSAKKTEMPTDWDYKWTDSHVDIVVLDAAEDINFQVTKITNFFRILGMKDVSTGIIGRLYDAGFTTIGKLIKANPTSLKKAEGVQDRTAERIHNEIQKVIKDVSLATLMQASGSWGPGFGDRRLTPIVQSMPNILDIKEDTIENRLMGMPGFNTKTVNAFIAGLKEFKKFLKTLPSSVTWNVPKAKKVTSGVLSGQEFVMTGFRSADLESLIERNGGKVGGSVSKKTTILITKTADTTSTKAKRAKELGVGIMSLKAFEAYIKKSGAK